MATRCSPSGVRSRGDTSTGTGLDSRSASASKDVTVASRPSFVRCLLRSSRSTWVPAVTGSHASSPDLPKGAASEFFNHEATIFAKNDLREYRELRGLEFRKWHENRR